MLTNREIIDVLDLGAGSRKHASNQRSIQQIARHSLKPTEIGQLLFRLVNRFKPEVIFDLGTSLGITTLYLATAQRKSQFLTFEGCPAIGKIALQNFERMGCHHIQLVEGNLDETLKRKASEVDRIDFAFFDANHRYQSTIDYFEICLSKAHEQSVFVFDDIHWSEDMEKAWQQIQSHPRVMISIDLFDVGLIFFRTNQPKQHFVLRR